MPFDSSHRKNHHLRACIPTLCECGCNGVVWGGNKYIKNHPHKKGTFKKGHYVSDALRKKISEGHKGQIAWSKGLKLPPLSTEHKKKISNALRGEKHHNYGKRYSVELCKKLSDAHKGQHSSPVTEFKKGHLPANAWKPRSDELRIILSEKNRGKHSSPATEFKKGVKPPIGTGSGKGGFYESPFQGTIYLRSTYELAYAKWLDANNIMWFYEFWTFDLGRTSYIPDFYLPLEEKFIEIKGYMRSHSQLKINRFLQEYPFIDLEILFKKDLYNLGVKGLR